MENLDEFFVQYEKAATIEQSEPVQKVEGMAYMVARFGHILGKARVDRFLELARKVEASGGSQKAELARRRVKIEKLMVAPATGFKEGDNAGRPKFELK